MLFRSLSAETRSALEEGAEQVDSAGEAFGFVFAAIFIVLFSILGGGASILSSLIAILICSFGVRQKVGAKEEGVAVKIPRERWVRIVFWSFLGTNAGMILANIVLFILLKG